MQHVKNHMLHSRATVLQATSHSYGVRQNLTLCNFVLFQPVIAKFGVVDYAGDPYSGANLIGYVWVRNCLPVDEI